MTGGAIIGAAALIGGIPAVAIGATAGILSFATSIGAADFLGNKVNEISRSMDQAAIEERVAELRQQQEGARDRGQQTEEELSSDEQSTSHTERESRRKPQQGHSRV